MNRSKDPQRFVDAVERVRHSQSETGVDEIELVDGLVLERYSSPVLGRMGPITAESGRITT